jgi:hypothetical protein
MLTELLISCIEFSIMTFSYLFPSHFESDQVFIDFFVLYLIRIPLSLNSSKFRFKFLFYFLLAEIVKTLLETAFPKFLKFTDQFLKKYGTGYLVGSEVKQNT